MTVKRYGSVLFDTGLIEMACGDYVTYSDYQKLVAENVRAVDAVKVFSKVTEEITYIICDEIGHEKVAEILGAFNDLGNMPNTDAAIAEIKAQGVDELAETWEAIKPEEGVSMRESTALKYKQRAQDAREFAANLRAGRKG